MNPDVWILEAKLVAPDPTAAIARPRLLEGPAAPVVLLEAGPGMGKSLALAQLAGSAGAGPVYPAPMPDCIAGSRDL